MTVITLYKYTRSDGGVDVSRTQPSGNYTVMYRLIADEGKAITDGETVTTCADVESTDGWTDCNMVYGDDEEATEEDFAAALEELGVDTSEEE